MKKFYLFSFVFLSLFSYGQEFVEFASGIKINTTIYNITGVTPNKINPDPAALNLDATNIGSFGQNSSCAKITGAEIKTFKNISSNVCSASLNWRVYLASAAPSGSFNSIPLNTVTDCNTGTNQFNDGFGGCTSGDQKWKDYLLSIDFITGLTPGDYVLEIYYSYTGSNTSTSTCETTKFISNSGSNYKASFKVVNPITSPTVSATSVCEGDSLTLTANATGGIAPYTFSWTGPNGYTSTTENPTINNVTISNSGVYSVIATDACGSSSLIQSTSTVVVNAKIDPVFNATLPAICKGGFAPVLSTTSTNGISGSWNPALVNNTTTTTYVFTPDAGQCANSLTFTIFVLNNVDPKFTLPASICRNSTPPILPTTSNNGIVGSWNPSVINNNSSGSYVFTPSAGQCATVTTINIEVNELVPVFTPDIKTICFGEITSPLPTTSTNGITGTWLPAQNNTATTTYTFTPNVGQCAPTTATTTMTIVVNPIEALFTQVTPICFGQTMAPLPTTSNNGVTGTWSPAINNTATTTYTFTPDAGQCTVNPFIMTIVVNPIVTPTFTSIAPFCSGLESPILPTTSINSVVGTWSPATVSNTASATYTFTPNADQCASTTTLDVTIIPKTIPLFDPIADVCYNSTPPSLPLTSTNGITGTWTPSMVSNAVSAVYTFTPSSGICATTTTLTINVNAIIPVFGVVSSICANATAPLLPSTSTNGIIGTWNPSTVSNTASATYVFTPDAGQCATTTTLNMTVNEIVTPSFTTIAPICSESVPPVLPLTSNNSITGTWNPATISNTLSGTYTFTPTAGQCANSTTLNVEVRPNVTPIFADISPLCSGEVSPVLPLTSSNGVVGTWNPAFVSNTVSGNYIFTPSAGQCGLTASLSVTVYPSPTSIALKTTDVVNERADGIIEITGVTSGVAPFTYSINSSSFTPNTTYSNLSPGDYTITVRDFNGCIFSKKATVNTVCLIPNSITPNNDTFNDTLDLTGCNIAKLRIYNRYGVEVNDFQNYTNQWDGKNRKGEVLADGTYYYVAETKNGTAKSGWIYVTR